MKKEKKNKILLAFPVVSMLSEIKTGNGLTVVGGFTDGGFFIKNTFELVKKESKKDNLVYYSFVKKEVKNNGNKI